MSMPRSHRIRRRSFLAGLGAVAAGVSLGSRRALAAEEARVNFYNWDTYIGETTLEDFAKATGVEVKMDLFADNDELFAKLKEGNPGYDLIVPTNDYVERMIAAGMLETLDHSKIPNIANLAPSFRDAAFDPGRKHSLPYMWGTIGIGYRKSRVDAPPDSWKWLYDSDRHSGRIAMLGDAGVVVQMGLKLLGKPLNSTEPALIKQVEEMLIRQKKHIKVFAEDNGQDLLASGEVDLTMEWNGDILQVMEEDDDIAFVVPREGGLLWQDCLCIPKGAPHPMNAHRFIDFLLDGENGAAIADFIQYATPNAAAKALMSAEYRENPAIFPPDSVIEICEASVYKGEEYQRLIDETWTRIQAA
ncbi:MAG: spermidine/putrescine ABC transporter substrate-binding protein [Ectothiorhodospiraceae bacterium]|nr:spermidine/putrescine ABC transporter substrate-binding protein [Ectothiorhodospiraceae bacterium]